MLRARLPLAVAMLAATLVIPGVAASAAETTPTATPTATPTETPTSTAPAAGLTTTTPTIPAEIPTTLPTAGANPAAGTPLQGLGDLLTDPSKLPSVITGLGTCLQSAGANPDAGQGCIENFFTSLGIPGADCFSQSGFTVGQATTKIEDALSGGSSSLTPETLQANLKGLAAQVQDLVTCLTASSAAPSTGTSSGGGAATPDTASGEAPAATPVSGTPNFTG